MENHIELNSYTAFEGQEQRFQGALPELLQYLTQQPAHATQQLLIFDNHTGRQVDFDVRGTAQEVLSRYLPTENPAGRGRPKLGVQSREVSLLPRHWEWLEAQGNASATLRRLIDEERKRSPKRPQQQIWAATDRFMSSIGGDLPNYQEATRALYRGELQAFENLLQSWPADIRLHALKMAQDGF